MGECSGEAEIEERSLRSVAQRAKTARQKKLGHSSRDDGSVAVDRDLRDKVLYVLMFQTVSSASGFGVWYGERISLE